eukprot:Phypoly_transcript_14948.p1 GENE.Phypoly_transcript_14948~~Phypoly_transcript_14948.p1  ORF type:complete len:304 (-),score=96.90 Phypoly_transcript_14948:48-935(-)
MAGVTQLPTVEFKDKKRKKGFKEKKRSKKSAQYDSGSEDERDGRTKLQKLNLVDKEGADEKMSEVYDGANFEKEVSSDDESRASSEEEADDEAEAPSKASPKSDKPGKSKGDLKAKDAAFGAAISQILNATVDEKTSVILSKNKILTTIIEKKKAKEQEKKDTAMQKKIISDQYHIKPNITTNKENETKLRKIATKGVVQLFTAVTAAQATEEKTKTLKATKTVTVNGQKKQVNEIEAAAFADLLKTKGKQTSAPPTLTAKQASAPPATAKKQVPKKPVIKKEIKVEKEEEYEDE